MSSTLHRRGGSLIVSLHWEAGIESLSTAAGTRRTLGHIKPENHFSRERKAQLTEGGLGLMSAANIFHEWRL